MKYRSDHDKGVKTATDWLPSLNAVRVLTALIVAMGYASTMPLGGDAHEIGSHFGYEPSWIGVQILFLFSGALALRSLDAGRSGWAYLRSRFFTTAPVLIAVTLATVLVIYPLCAAPQDASFDTAIGLVKYFVLTVTALDPGRPLPGLLDSAPYACLIQGAIWTLRWGLLFHFCAALVGRFAVLRSPRLLATAALSAVISYVSITYLAVKQDWQSLIHIVTGMRLLYPFLIGMALWAYKDRLPQSKGWIAALCLGPIILAGLKYHQGPWSPLIEIGLIASWGFAAWTLALSARMKAWFTHSFAGRNWHITPAIYMVNWPVAQIILMNKPDISAAMLSVLTVGVSLALAVLLHAGLTGRLSRQIAVQTARP